MASEIINITNLDARDFAPLLETESRVWREALRWDFTAPARMISACLREKRISGYALAEAGRLRGYCFFFCEGDKGLIGNLFVEPDGKDSHRAAFFLLERVIETLTGNGGVHRVEAQLPHFTFEQLDSCFHTHCFQGYRRRFMAVSLKNRWPRVELPGGSQALSGQKTSRAFEDFLMQPWERKHDRAAAELLHASYVNHVDAIINDQYRWRAGTARLLDNIVRHPGTGMLLPEASLVAIHQSTQKLASILAMTEVRPRTAHIPQIAVAQEFQGAGLGTAMMELSFAELAREGYDEVSLTVTELNGGAVRLYERLGFETFRTFGAFVWNRT